MDTCINKSVVCNIVTLVNDRFCCYLKYLPYLFIRCCMAYHISYQCMGFVIFQGVATCHLILVMLMIM